MPPLAEAIIEECYSGRRNGSVNDNFGFSVGITDGVALVGAYHDDDACPDDISGNSGRSSTSG